MIAEALKRHERIALLFSGGKDSLACLELARPYLDRITVTWVNTGSVFPEIAELMEQVRADVPYFLEINSNVNRFIAEVGVPSDIVPVSATPAGRALNGSDGMPITSWLECCMANIWMPMASAWKRLGVTAVIRGQRDADVKRSPYRHGSHFDGVEFIHPIEDWTDEQVRGYLEARGIEIDERLSLAHSSLDCRVCTGFLDETADRLAYLKRRHPRDAEYVITTVRSIGEVIQRDLQPMCDLLEGG
ncbi:MAG TPA: phosphoadenosine phosphosulfate reductase family protein [Burkholderiaceae bacterium]|nr:phosphoadenosine phosphosulfate reductase family protein [Burkholderiaceae bacterium]